jgi:hypothetical protein
MILHAKLLVIIVSLSGILLSVFKRCALLVGTGHNAVLAAHTLVVVNHHYTILAPVAGLGGTNIHARRLFAVIAQQREGMLTHHRILTGLAGDHSVKEDARRQKIGLLAAYLA